MVALVPTSKRAAVPSPRLALAVGTLFRSLKLFNMASFVLSTTPKGLLTILPFVESTATLNKLVSLPGSEVALINLVRKVSTPSTLSSTLPKINSFTPVSDNW